MFSNEFFVFFDNLVNNNNKAWFDDNKESYVNVVKNPFLEFITDLLNKMKVLDSNLYEHLEPKHCIYRINRDVRFSKDKQPYKNYAGAFFSPEGKNTIRPGFYVHFGAQECMVAGGFYCMTPDVLRNVRYYLIQNLDKLNEELNNPLFKSTFGEILGEKSKKLPKDMEHYAQNIPLLYNKQFYFQKNITRLQVISPDLLENIFDYYLASRGMMFFLNQGI